MGVRRSIDSGRVSQPSSRSFRSARQKGAALRRRMRREKGFRRGMGRLDEGERAMNDERRDSKTRRAIGLLGLGMTLVLAAETASRAKPPVTPTPSAEDIIFACVN